MNPKAPFAECDGCPLQDRPHALGRGPDKARVVIVGEAPGATEVKTGVPFIGKAGQLLTKILEQHGIDREEVYITNTVLCRPPLKDGKNTPPKADAIKRCKARLAAEIKSKQPQAVLALGGIAAKTLLETREGITALRIGGAKRSALVDAPVVATFHPASAFYSPDNLPSIMSDVKKLTKPEISLGWEPTQVEVPDIETAGSRLFEVIENRESDLVSLDIENAPPFYRREPDFLSTAISTKRGSAIVFNKETINSRVFQSILAEQLRRKDLKWLMQGGKYDIQYLWSFEPEARVDEDTMLMHYLTDERKGTHSLEQLGTEFLDTPRWKTEAKMGEDDEEIALADLPPEILHLYNGTDTDVTLRLHPVLKENMESDDVLRPYQEIVMPATNALADMEYRGISVDLEELERLGTIAQEACDVTESQLQQWVTNPRSPKQLLAAFEALDIPLPKTDKATLRDVDHDLARLTLRYREHHKELSTYIKGIHKHIEPDGKVRSNFKIQGTETGRLSSSKPNMQNITKGAIQGMFVASSPDRVLVTADYSNIELRVAAIIVGTKWLTDVFKEGRSIHKEVALELFGPNYTEHQYRDGKAVTFGIWYDRREFAIAAQLTPDWLYMTEAQRRPHIKKAKAMIDGWKRNVPELDVYHENIRNTIKEQQYLRSYYGRVRRFWMITEDNKLDVFREGYNFPIQSMAGDITTTALTRAVNYFKGKDWAFPVITIHDSIVFDVLKDRLMEFRMICNDIMETTVEGMLMPVEMKYAYRWGSDELAL